MRRRAAGIGLALMFLVAQQAAGCGALVSTGGAGGASGAGGTAGSPNGAAPSADTGGSEDASSGAATPSPSGSAPTPASPAGLDAEEADFIVRLNAYRQGKGLGTLKASSGLQAAAAWKSANMAQTGYFEHDDPDGRSTSDRIRSYYAYSSFGENIAMGHADAAATFEQWRTSSGHNANMLGKGFTEVGIARRQDPSIAWGWYWTCDLGSPRGGGL